jgi:hypothetical protein
VQQKNDRRAVDERKLMSAYGMILTVLCTNLAEAVAKDEAPEVGGFDLSAGMFGPNVSEWLRGVAVELERGRDCNKFINQALGLDSASCTPSATPAAETQLSD